ncbi:unnamed protein product [Clavelina lepadiformis]|uniref:Uncharacterized protein n=1 Tax=Clavelina lepadiformis TaxID=159417 RepID=A0ABP0H2M5_CLALP
MTSFSMNTNVAQTYSRQEMNVDLLRGEMLRFIAKISTKTYLIPFCVIQNVETLKLAQHWETTSRTFAGFARDILTERPPYNFHATALVS